MGDPQPDPVDHDHDGHEHGHARSPGLLTRPGHVLRPHSHGAAGQVGAVIEGSAEGLRALWISLAVLGATALIEAAGVALSGSVALLGDALHNAADALTAVPLGIAFIAGRRPPTRRYTYGYGRAEDLAGVVVVLIIAASSALVAYQAISRLAAAGSAQPPWSPTGCTPAPTGSPPWRCCWAWEALPWAGTGPIRSSAS